MLGYILLKSIQQTKQKRLSLSKDSTVNNCRFLSLVIYTRPVNLIYGFFCEIRKL